ncbi:MAG TPA: hypothetical protein PK992_07565, partial [Planctomycetaceae bacterium]|nr:hypothetical protein [Planctomycetaceae bacterium]
MNLFLATSEPSNISGGHEENWALPDNGAETAKFFDLLRARPLYLEEQRCSVLCIYSKNAFTGNFRLRNR